MALRQTISKISIKSRRLDSWKTQAESSNDAKIVLINSKSIQNLQKKIEKQ